MAAHHQRCSGCGAPMPAVARWCGRCGTALARPASVRAWQQLGSGPARRRSSVTLAAVLTALVGAAALAVVGIEAPASAPGAAGVELPPTDDGALFGTGRRGSIPTGRDWPVCRNGDAMIACVRWQARLGPHERVAIAAAHRRVVAAGSDGTVQAFDLWSGEPRWTVTVAGPNPPRLLPVVASTLPVAVGDRTVFVDLDTGSQVGEVVAPDPKVASTSPGWLVAAGATEISAWGVNGEVAWTHRFEPDATPLLTPRAPYLATSTGRLTRLVGTTGAPRWQVDLGAEVRHVVPVADGLIAAVDDDPAQLVGLDDRGERRWTRHFSGSPVWLEADAAGSLVAVVVAAPEGARLTVLDAATGRIGITTTLADRASGTLPPAIRGTSVAVAHAGPQPQLTLVRDERVHLQLPLDRMPRAIAFTGPDTLAVTDGASVTLWSLEDGAPRWRAELGASADTVLGEPLVVVGDRGIVSFYAES